MTVLSDEFLLAYLDGQLEKGQAADVTALAGTNAEIARRLSRLKRTQAQLIETFGTLAREDIRLPKAIFAAGGDGPKLTSTLEAGSPPIAQPPRDFPALAAGQKQMFFIAAVFAGGLLGGYGATLIFGSRPPESPKSTDRPYAPQPAPVYWATDISRFHGFFPKETLTPHPDAISNPDLIRFQLTKVAAKPLTPPDFNRQGFSLFRGQVFTYGQDRMMQLTYASKTEPPLTLYILPGASSADSGPMANQVAGGKAVSWVADKIRFFLTSDKSEDDLKVLAVLAQSQMPKKI